MDLEDVMKSKILKKYIRIIVALIYVVILMVNFGVQKLVVLPNVILTILTITRNVKIYMEVRF